MCVACGVMYSAAAVSMAVGPVYDLNNYSNSQEAHRSVQANIIRMQDLSPALSRLVPPSIEKPDWYKAQAGSQSGQQMRTRPNRSHVTYTVSTKGDTSSDLKEFARQANETLNHSRGWSQLGVEFKQVDSGGDFNLVLSQAEYLPSFSSACSVDWSCRVGKSVIINDNRWRGASLSWNRSGGSLRDYRHMVINHEVGHWLGHGHQNCSSKGTAAAVMQQQSIDLQDCVFNPWPLESELWSTTLGVRKI